MALADVLNEYGGSIKAATRYVAVAGAASGATVGVIVGLNPDQVAAAVKAAVDLGNATSTVLISLGSLISLLVAWYGARQASKTQQAITLTKDGTTQLKVTKDATPALQALALNTDVKGVVPAPGVQP